VEMWRGENRIRSKEWRVGGCDGDEMRWS
jgi:hypothetical protein